MEGTFFSASSLSLESYTALLSSALLESMASSPLSI